MFSDLREVLFMPTYEYKCKDCGCTFEKFQSIVDNPVTQCKDCGGSVHRLISKNVSFILKGSGFYSTDNPKTGRKTEKKKTLAQTKEDTSKKDLPKKNDTKKIETKDKEKKSLPASVK